MMSAIANHLFCHAKFCTSCRLVSSPSKISCFAESLPPLPFDFRGLIRSQLLRLCGSAICAMNCEHFRARCFSVLMNLCAPQVLKKIWLFCGGSFFFDVLFWRFVSGSRRFVLKYVFFFFFSFFPVMNIS